jgi:hypothetical protein
MSPDPSCAKVRSKPPPLWLIRWILNPLMFRVVPTRLGRWLPGVAVLRFRGRKSGRAYVVPAGIYDHEGAQVVFTDSTWRMNFVGGAPVEVTRRGCRTMGYGELVTDPAYVGTAIRTCLARGASLTMLGLSIDKGHNPTDEELSAVRDAVVIRRRQVA